MFYTLAAAGIALAAINWIFWLTLTGNRIVSYLWFLVHQNRLQHAGGNRLLPTVPYTWPNGQGDVGKFLEGIENSEEWQSKYGGIYRIWSGMNPEIVLTKPDHIKMVFKDSDKHRKAPDNNSGYLMSQVLGKCVGLISGEDWKRVRGVSGAAFARRSISSHVELIQQRVRDHLREIEKHGGLSIGRIDPVQDLKMLPFFTVADVIYGKLSDSMERELRELAPIHDNLFKHVIRGGITRLWVSKYLPTEANRALRKFQMRWARFNELAYRRALEHNLIETPIAQLFGALNTGEISIQHALHTLDEALYANLDVTMGGLSWNLVFLASEPDIQRKLRTEIWTARDCGGMESYLLSSATFLDACICESSRLKPLAAFSVPQSAPTDRVLDGYRIPAGTSLVVDSYALNIRNDFWGSDRGTYRPSRFLEVNRTEARYNFWRFGFGPRQCMGRYVADVIIRTLLVELLERWELHLPEGEKGTEWDRDRENWITHPQIKLRCQPVSRMSG